MQKIGVRISKWREERNITQEQLAELAGLTVPFLAALEQEDLIPSLGPLQKISRALGVRLGTFMDDQVTKDPIISRAGERTEDLTIREARSKNPSFHYMALGKGKSDRNMEPFLIDVVEAMTDETSSHQGEEFIYVMEGDLLLEYGREAHLLHAGDSVYYNSIVPHSVNASNGPARILAVVYYPL